MGGLPSASRSASRNTVTSGIVQRQVAPPLGPAIRTCHFIQTERLPVNPGNSGGPAVQSERAKSSASIRRSFSPQRWLSRALAFSRYRSTSADAGQGPRFQQHRARWNRHGRPRAVRDPGSQSGAGAELRPESLRPARFVPPRSKKGSAGANAGPLEPGDVILKLDGKEISSSSRPAADGFPSLQARLERWTLDIWRQTGSPKQLTATDRRA